MKQKALFITLRSFITWRHSILALLACFVASFLTACGGGGGGSSPRLSAPILTLSSPSSEDIIGETLAIRWSTDGGAGTVQIALSNDSGVTFTEILASGITDTGSFDFETTALAEGSTYRLQLTPFDSAGNPADSVTMDGDFSIDLTSPVVTLEGPAPGEIWNGTQQITWETSDDNPDTVDVFLSADSGTTFDTVIAEGLADTGSMELDTNPFSSAGTYRIRIVARDAAGYEGTPAEFDADIEIDHVPRLQNAQYLDADQDGSTNVGDQVVLSFSAPISLDSADASSFELPVSSDSLGTNPSFRVDAERDLVITLGATPTLKARQLFSDSSLTANSATGLGLASDLATGTISNPGTGDDAVSDGFLDLEPAFDPQSNFGEGETTFLVAVDLDHDGDEDLVRGLVDAGTQIWTNDGSGAYIDSGQSLGGTSSCGTVADFDRDGDLDLVIGDDDAGAAKFWQNDGAAIFTDSGQSLNLASPQAVAYGDLDADGDLDLVFGNENAANTLWMNDGNAVFSDSSDRLGSAATVAIVIADFDLDGDLDLFAVNAAESHQLWENDGAGTFSQGAQSFPIRDATDCALADFDANGAPDVLVTHALTSWELFSNDGTGAFTRSAPSNSSSPFTAVVTGDLDRSGSADIVLSRQDAAPIALYNNGAGSFVVETTLAESGGGVVAITDSDADGDLDVIEAQTNQGIRMWCSSLSACVGSFTFNQTQSLTASDIYVVSMGDIDNDGDLDLILGSPFDDTLVYHNDGTGTFSSGDSLPLGSEFGMTLFDADRDGDLDLARASFNSTSEVWSNDGSGDFSLADTLTTSSAVGIDHGDFDRDGDWDLIQLNWLSTANSIWTNDGSADFSDSGQSLGSESSMRGWVADLDQDGDLDCLAAADSGDLRIPFLNDGTGTFSAGVGFSASGRCWTPALGDFDKDGDTDVALGTTSGEVTFWTNGGSADYTDSGVTIPVGSVADVAVADIDLDGDLDLIFSDQSTDAFYLLNDGNGAFSASLPINTSDSVSVAAGDLDGDGDIDLVFGRFSNVLIYLNQ